MSSLLTTLGLLEVCVVAASFMLHYFHQANRPTEPKLSRTEYLRAIAVESAAVWFTTLLHPLGWIPQASGKDTASPQHRPIVLVPGLLPNRSSMYILRRRLQNHGYRNVHILDTGPAFGSLETAAQRLLLELEPIVNQARMPVSLIAYGTGGIACRHLLDTETHLDIHTLITIGTPHQGSLTAVFTPWENGQQTRVGSSFLDALGASPRYRLVSIASLADNMVVPPANAACGTQTVQLRHHGHLTLLYVPEVFDSIVAELPSPVATDEPSADQPHQSPG